MEKKISKLDNFFGITESGSTIRTEIVAGCVSFLAMAYILIINPSAILSADANATVWSSVFLSTAFGAVLGTVFLALIAKSPLAQAPGMGINYMIGAILGGSLGFAVSFGNAMLLVMISGVLFVLLSVVKIKKVSIREMIFDAVPDCVRKAIGVGIGLFIAFIGLQNAGIIVDPATMLNDSYTQWQLGERLVVYAPGTLVDLVAFNSYTDGYKAAGAIVCIIGLIVIAVLEHFKVKGAVIIGIIVATIIGIPLKVTPTSSTYSWKFWEYFQTYFSFDGSREGGIFFACFTEGFSWASDTSVITCIMTVITLCMVDMFDTMGTIVGCCSAAGLADENGKPLKYNGIMLADSLATCTGAMFGTSSVTTFVEAGAGVSAGGKTGLTALTTAFLFFLSIFLLPIISMIPSAAASSALLYVGCLMLKAMKDIKLDSMKNIIPTFLTIAMIPLCYSITDGIGFGLISSVIINLIIYVVSYIKYARNKEVNEKPVWDINFITVIVAILFLVYFFVPTVF